MGLICGLHNAIANPEVYMDAVGDDLGATVGNIINCSYKLMTQIKPDALLILGDICKCQALFYIVR